MGVASVFVLTAALLASSAAEKYAGRLVSTIDIVLEGGTPPEAAQSLVEIRAGEPYRQEAVRRSIKQLFALGGKRRSAPSGFSCFIWLFPHSTGRRSYHRQSPMKLSVFTDEVKRSGQDRAERYPDVLSLPDAAAGASGSEPGTSKTWPGKMRSGSSI